MLFKVCWSHCLFPSQKRERNRCRQSGEVFVGLLGKGSLTISATLKETHALQQGKETALSNTKKNPYF